MHDDIEFEDIPMEQARHMGRMGRGPRMEPILYNTLRTGRHEKLSKIV